jgi:molybdate transport system permease protein
VGEFGVVLMLGGDIPGKTRTLSIALLDQVQDANYAAANQTALLLLLGSALVLLVVYGGGTASPLNRLWRMRERSDREAEGG